MRERKQIKIGTRRSKLAWCQASLVQAQLAALAPEKEFILTPIAASGDLDLVTPLHALPAPGAFVKELQTALLAGEVDLAVHSLKDLPVQEPDGLCLAALLPREEPADALLYPLNDGNPARGPLPLPLLPEGTCVGTSSLRRQAQLKGVRPDLTFSSLRGNLDTRLRKLAAGEVGALVLAWAGLARLGLLQRREEGKPTPNAQRDWELYGELRQAGAVPSEEMAAFGGEQAVLQMEEHFFTVVRLPLALCLPAPGQGVLAVEARVADVELRALVAALHHPPTAAASTAERAVLAALGGGCSLPVGALGEVRGEQLTLTAAVADLTGQQLRVRDVAPLGEGERLGERLAAPLRAWLQERERNC